MLWALIALGLLAAACSGGGGEVDLAAGEAAAGERVFGTHCAACHGAQGEGTPSGPPLVGPDGGDSTPQEIVAAVQEGVSTDEWPGAAMPALPAVGDDELADVVAYLRQLRGDAPSP